MDDDQTPDRPEPPQAPKLITLTRGKSWELTTAHGTRIVVALGSSGARSQWMRLPARHADGTVNASRYDGRWQRLFGISQPNDDGQHGQTRRGGQPIWRIRLDAPVKIYIGMNEWWATTDVISVRELEDAELPQERRGRR